jgi:hypothetical protein
MNLLSFVLHMSLDCIFDMWYVASLTQMSFKEGIKDAICQHYLLALFGMSWHLQWQHFCPLGRIGWHDWMWTNDTKFMNNSNSTMTLDIKRNFRTCLTVQLFFVFIGDNICLIWGTTYSHLRKLDIFSWLQRHLWEMTLCLWIIVQRLWKCREISGHSV